MAYVQSGQDSDDAGPSRVDITLTGVVSGNYIVAFGVGESDTGSMTFTTQSGSTSSWTQTVDQLESGDFAVIGAAYATASSTGDVTVRIEGPGGSNTYAGGIVMEIDDINAYDASQYNRTAASVTSYTTTAGTPSGYDTMMVGFGMHWASSPGGDTTATTGWDQRIIGMNYPDQLATDAGGCGETRVYTSGNGQASFDVPSTSSAKFGVHMFFTENAAGAANPKGPLGHPLHGPFAGPVGP